MLAICILGTNACGKSTLLQRIEARYPALRYIYADRGSFYKKEVGANFRSLLKEWCEPEPVVLMEGTRIGNPVFQVYGAAMTERQLALYILTQEPDVMEVHLKLRCAQKQKTYNAAYWTEWKRGYEGKTRYLNLAKRAPVTRVKYFAVDVEFKIMDEVERSLIADIDEVLACCSSS